MKEVVFTGENLLEIAEMIGDAKYGLIHVRRGETVVLSDTGNVVVIPGGEEGDV